MRFRQVHVGRLGKARERRLDEGLAVDRHVERLAHPDVVKRRLRPVQEYLEDVQRRPVEDLEVLGALDDDLLARRQLINQIVLPGGDGTHARGQLGNDGEFDTIGIWPVRLPVFLVALDDDLLAVRPTDKGIGAGADRRARDVTRGAGLERGRRHHHAGAIAEDAGQGGVGRIQLQRHLHRAGDGSGRHGRKVGLDVGFRIGLVALQVEFDRLRIERRAVVERHARTDVENEGRRIGKTPALRQTRLRLQRLKIPLGQRIVHGEQKRVIRAGTAGGGVEARGVGGSRNAQGAAALRRALRMGTATERDAGHGARQQRHRLAARRPHFLSGHGIVLFERDDGQLGEKFGRSAKWQATQ